MFDSDYARQQNWQLSNKKLIELNQKGDYVWLILISKLIVEQNKSIWIVEQRIVEHPNVPRLFVSGWGRGIFGYNSILALCGKLWIRIKRSDQIWSRFKTFHTMTKLSSKYCCFVLTVWLFHNKKYSLFPILVELQFKKRILKQLLI